MKTKIGLVPLATFAMLAAGTAMVSAGSLVSYQASDHAIAKSLTGKAGDPIRGRSVAANRKKGNCLACHEISDLKDQPYHGKIGPSLDGVADRYNEGELRLRVVNSKALNEDSAMPAFYRVEGLHRVLKKFKGKPILSAQDVEDVIAYLRTMKEK